MKRLIRLRNGVGAICLILISWLFTAVTPVFQPVASQSEASYEFGQAIHFSLLIQGSQPVTGVTLFFRSSDSPATTTVDIEIEPDKEVLVEHTVELTQLRLAPFSTISFWWQVTDADGNVLDVPTKTIEYEDDRFEWRELRTETVIVRWTNEEAALGQTALDVVDEALPRLAAIIPVRLPEPLRIYIYPSSSDLQSSLRLTGREWVGGHTNPELGVILVTAANARTAAGDLRQSIPHELTHLILYQAAGLAYDNFPQWFNEGMAATMENDPDPNEALILAEAVGNGETISFSDLCQSFPGDGRQAVLAYAQSASLIEFIKAEYGNITLNDMVLALADGADCESVSTRVLGVSLEELNQNWLTSINEPSSVSQFWERGTIWFLLLIAGFGLMVVFFWPIKKG